MKNIIPTIRNNNQILQKINECTVGQKAIIDSIEYVKRDKLLIYLGIYLEHKLDLSYLRSNWSVIEKLGRDSSSRASTELRYGEEYGNILFNKKSKECAVDRNKLVDKYGELRTKEMLSGRAGSIDSYIRRHGEALGIIKWNEYCEKRRETFKSKRGTYTSHDLTWFQNKYGKDQGLEIWDKKRKDQAYKVSTAWYIEQYGEENGRALMKKCKSRSLAFFIEKYGEIEGEKRYSLVAERRAKAVRHRVSKWSTQCIIEILKQVTDLYYYGENELICNLDRIASLELKQRIILPDIFYRGGIIEFQGDIFHGNPAIFKEGDTPHPYKRELTAGEIQTIDRIKHEFYKRKGYEVLEIWETQWKTQPELTLKKCLDFLIPRMKSSQ
jgi:hypothetical protein